MIPETVYTRSGRKAGGFSTVSDLFGGKSSDAILSFLTHDSSLCVNCSTCCLLIKFVVLCRQLNKTGQAIATVGTELLSFFYKQNTKYGFLPKINFHKWGGLHFF